jgi:hypothetical protein
METGQPRALARAVDTARPALFVAAGQLTQVGTDAGGLQLKAVLPAIRLFTTAMKPDGLSKTPPPNGAVFTMMNEFSRNASPVLSRPPPRISAMLNWSLDAVMCVSAEPVANIPPPTADLFCSANEAPKKRSPAL